MATDDTTTAFTPGPWTLGTGFKTAKNHAVCAGPCIVATVCGLGYPIGEGWSVRSEANARLIAAAPALLAALKPLAFCALDNPPPGVAGEDWRAAVIAARAAIADAQGTKFCDGQKRTA